MPPKPFKPPRPSVKKTTKTKPTSTGARKSSNSISKPAAKPRARGGSRGSSSFARPAVPSHGFDSEPDPFAAEEAADTTLRVEDERQESIPPELLTRLLHECFTHEGTRLSREANAAVGKYVETFVREAMARAAFMRAEAEAGGGGGDGFLEVEDLEKLAPQLILDF
jgi:centromere protein X